MTPEEALEMAVELVGGKAELARQIGVKPQALQGWTICPHTRVLAVEAAVRRAQKRLKRGISKHDLRPDLYPRRR